MGLLDGLLKDVAKAVIGEKGENITEQKLRENKTFNSMEQWAQKADRQAEADAAHYANEGSGASSQPAPVSAVSGNGRYDAPAAPKPEYEYKTTEYGDDSKYEISFKISGDFIDFDTGAAEVPVAFQYAPDSDPDTFESDLNEPIILIEDYNSRMGYGAEFKNTGSINGAWGVTPLSGRFYVKGFAKLTMYDGKIIYFYAFDRVDYWKDSLLYVRYDPKIQGTSLEAQLVAALDRIAETYTETLIGSGND